MKSYLCSNKGLFKLGSTVTSIGKHGCDLILKHPTIETQHALIEFTNDGITEGFFTIVDLGSHHGTYVNHECINANFAVLLENHSVIQFGKESTIFEFVIEEDEYVNNNHYKQAWTTNTLNTNHNNYLITEVGMQLPKLNTSIYTTMKSYSNSANKLGGPRAMLPPASRTRPVSAELLNRHLSPAPNRKQTGGWLNGPHLMRSSSSSDLHYLEEKEIKLEHLEKDLKRLNHIEVDSQKKDIIINRLGQEINLLKQHITNFNEVVDNNSFQDKLYYLEKEVLSKKEEISILKNKINRLNVTGSEDNLTYRASDIKESMKRNIDALQTEKHDLNQQINILKNNLIAKDEIIEINMKQINEMKLLNESYESSKCQINNELENIKHQKQQQDQQIDDLLNQNESCNNTILKMQNETSKILHDLKKSEQINQEIKDDFNNQILKNEENLQNLMKLENENIILLKTIDEYKDKEKTVEYSINNILEMHQLSADTSLESFPNIISNFLLENMNLKSQNNNNFTLIETQNSEIKMINSFLDLAIENMENFETNTTTKSLKEVMSKLSNTIPEATLESKLKQVFIKAINFQILNEDRIINMLEKHSLHYDENCEDIYDCIDNKLYEWKKHHLEISALKREVDEVKNNLHLEMASLERDLNHQHAKEITQIQSSTREENMELKERLQNLQQELDRHSLDENLSRKNQMLLENENAKFNSMLSEMNKEMVERNQYIDKLKKENIDFCKTLEEYKLKESDYQQRISQQEVELTRLSGNESKERMQSLEQELCERSEQVRQHALTICAMDEQINIAAVKTKEYREEISRLKNTISDLQCNGGKLVPAPPCKPHPRVHVATPLLRETTTHIQRENNDLMQKLAEQNDVIQALRRDLACSEARLTDVQGEISEEGKREAEEHEFKIRRNDAELIELQQQLLQLTQLVDQLNEQLAEARSSSDRLTDELTKKNELVRRHEAANAELQNQFKKSKADAKLKIDALEEHQKVSADLSLQGASCRGDRHDVVIARQREALTEMRAKIRALESGDIPLLSQSEAVQQVAFMREELDELRNQYAKLNSVKSSANNHASLQLNQALQLSEYNYANLMRDVAGCLNLKDIEDVNILRDQEGQEAIAQSRSRNHALVLDAIESLKQSVQRKENLPLGIDNDITQLRHRRISNDKQEKHDLKLRNQLILKQKKKSLNDEDKATLSTNHTLFHKGLHIEKNHSKILANQKHSQKTETKPHEKTVSFRHKELDVL